MRAASLAGTTISEGLIGRIVILIVGTILGIFFVVRYAERVKKDPTKSPFILYAGTYGGGVFAIQQVVQTYLPLILRGQ